VAFEGSSAYASGGGSIEMDVTHLPFNRLIGLEPAATDEFLVSLRAGPQHANHLGTVHASALLAVAEAGSGAFLTRHLGDPAGFVPVVRRLDAKFRRPASGRVSARAAIDPSEVSRWAARGRVSAAVPVEVVDAAGVVVLTATVEWFIARGPSGGEVSKQ
jgi:acyl-coenzyme A thioesterase PaaI-like protein